MLKENIKLSIVKDVEKVESSVLVVFLFKNEKIPKDLEKFFPQISGVLKDANKRKEFVGEKNQTLTLTLEKEGKFYKIILFAVCWILPTTASIKS